MNKSIKKKIIPITLLTTMICYTTPIFAFTKDETVYSKVDTAGKTYKTIVSTHISNKENLDIINDVTDLLSIENTSGDENFSRNDNTLVWDAKGKDIFYKGETQKELPISVEITYELDGKEMSAEEIAGKSGRVTVKIKYKNTQEHLVNINGKNEKLYTPFMIIGGTIIDNKQNANISVKNAKLISDGTKNIVIGVALPGVQESLEISESVLNIPSGFEITMDTTDFELNSIMTFATPRLLDEENSEIINEVTSVCNKLELIKSSTNSLKDGAETLKFGTNQYSENSELFNEKMQTLLSNISYINNNYTNINAGISGVSSNIPALQDGLKKMEEGITGITTMLTNLSSKLEGINNNLSSIKTKQDTVQNNLGSIVTELSGITGDNNSELIAELQSMKSKNNEKISGLDAINDSDIIQLLQNNNMEYDKTIAKLQAINSTSIVNVKDKVSVASENLKATNAEISSLISSISNIKNGIDGVILNLNALNKNVSDMYGKVSLVSANAVKLQQGSQSVKDGLNTLEYLTGKLKTANDELTTAARTISLGANELSNGMTTFDTTIGKYINGNIKKIATRAEALVELANEYDNFTMTNEQENSKVKFIIMTDELKRKDR